ncbi:MAG: AAA family ATPase [Actinomycetota bacterium]
MGRADQVEFFVLGALRARRGDREVHLRGNQRSTLLATLLRQPGTVVSFETLEDELGTSRSNVQKARAKLLADLELVATGASDVLETVGDGYRLDADAVSTDADHLVRLATRAERATHSDPATALVLADEGLAMWGEPFAGIEIGRRVSDYTVTLELARQRLLTARARSSLELGDHGMAAMAYRELRMIDRFDESVCDGLVRALVALGNRHDALDVMGELAASYRERGWVMSAAMSRLEQELLTDDLTFVPVSPALPTRVVAPLPERRVIRGVELLSGRTTGHRRELAEIERVAVRALQGRPAAIFIEGVAGMGKTWLVEELAATGTAQGFRVAWVDFLEAQEVGPQILLEAVRGALHEVVPERAEALSLDNLAPTVLDVSRDDPVAIILDDLQWADQRTIDQLEVLLRLASRPNSRQCRLFVLGAHRPLELDGGVPERLDRALRHRCARSMPLTGLDELDVHGLFRSLGIPRPSPFTLSLLRETTGGSPLALHRTLTELATRGALVEEAGLTEIDLGAMSSLDEMSTTELGRRRIVELSDDQRRAALAIAVLGDHATHELTRGLLDHVGVDPELTGELIADGLVRDRGQRLQFDHPTTPAALHADANDDEIAAGHRAAAAVLRSSSDRSPAALRWEADHLLRGRELAADWRRAACGAAGEAAMAVASWSEADRYFSAALEAAVALDEPSSDLIALKLRLAHAAFRDHQTRRAAELFDEAAEHGRANGDLAVWGEGLVNRGRSTLHDLARFDPAQEREELELFTKSVTDQPEHDGRRAEAYQRLALISWSDGDHARAEVEAEDALAAARQAGDHPVIARAAMTLGLARQDQFDLAGAERAFRISIDAADAVEMPTFVDWGRSRIARVLLMQGDPERAIEMAERAADRADRTANWAEAALARTNLAAALNAAGHHHRASSEAREAVRLYIRSRFRWVGAALIPLAHQIAIDGEDERLLEELAEVSDSTHPGGTLSRAIEALHLDDESGLEVAARVLRERCASPLSPQLARFSLGASVAERLGDRDLAQLCLDALTDEQLAEIVMIPVANRRRDVQIEACRRTLAA